MKECKQCKITKPFEQFYKHSIMSDGLHYYCIECMRERSRVWRSKNKDRIKKRDAERAEYFKEYRARPEVVSVRREQSRKWASENKARRVINEQKRRAAKLAGGVYTQKEWDDLCDKYDHKCLSCQEHKPLTVDHVIPLSKGGRNEIQNLQPLCFSCNVRKSNKTIDYRLKEK